MMHFQIRLKILINYIYITFFFKLNPFDIVINMIESGEAERLIIEVEIAGNSSG